MNRNWIRIPVPGYGWWTYLLCILFFQLIVPTHAQSDPDSAVPSNGPIDLCLTGQKNWNDWRGAATRRSIRLTCGENAQLVVIPDPTGDDEELSLPGTLEEWVSRHANLKIKKLTIVAHGSEGLLDLGGFISSNALERSFQALAPMMSVNATVDVNSCTVGANCRGRVFMARLASTLLPKGGTVLASRWYMLSAAGVTGLLDLAPIQLTYFGEGSQMLWGKGHQLVETLEEVCIDEFRPAYASFSDLMNNSTYRDLATDKTIFSQSLQDKLDFYLRTTPFQLEVLEDETLSTIEKLDKLDQSYRLEFDSVFGGALGLWLRSAVETLRNTIAQRARSAKPMDLLTVPLL